mmetsp:Transcript_13969/g.39757  ORF Transcript_13969/g.39757 Transcript_13969/m.39757 type:complete len:201 (+) Transcript_13969:1161-1763(+)
MLQRIPCLAISQAAFGHDLPRRPDVVMFVIFRRRCTILIAAKQFLQLLLHFFSTGLLHGTAIRCIVTTITTIRCVIIIGRVTRSILQHQIELLNFEYNAEATTAQSLRYETCVCTVCMNFLLPCKCCDPSHGCLPSVPIGCPNRSGKFLRLLSRHPSCFVAKGYHESFRVVVPLEICFSPRMHGGRCYHHRQGTSGMRAV